MKNQFVLFKIYRSAIYSKRYNTIDEMKNGYANEEGFLGEPSAEYDLEVGKYRWMKDLHGEGSLFEEILQKLKDDYKAGK